jgi:predicted esterase
MRTASKKVWFFLLCILLCGCLVALSLAKAFFSDDKSLSTFVNIHTPSPSPSPLASLLPSPSASVTPLTLSTHVSLRRLKTYETEHLLAAQAHFLKNTQLTPKATQVTHYELKYTIVLTDQDPIPIRASVFVPHTRAQLPLFVFGSGTTGVADHCAPSLENVSKKNMGDYTNHMVAQAAQNYIVVFPDYVGFNDENRDHPYFVAELEARTLLGAVEQIFVLHEAGTFPTLQKDAVFLSGYSQGGHAALAAASRRHLLPDSIPITGVITYASAENVTALLSESPRLAPYILYAYEQYYDIDLNADAVLQPQWVSSLERDATRLCVTDAYAFYPNSLSAMYTEVFAHSLLNNSLETVHPELHRLLQENSRLENLENTPILVLQGEKDPIVTAQTQRLNVQQLCQIDAHVYYHEFSGIDHFKIRQVGFKETQDWLKRAAKGEPLASNCVQTAQE